MHHHTQACFALLNIPLVTLVEELQDVDDCSCAVLTHLLTPPNTTTNNNNNNNNKSNKNSSYPLLLCASLRNGGGGDAGKPLVHALVQRVHMCVGGVVMQLPPLTLHDTQKLMQVRLYQCCCWYCDGAAAAGGGGCDTHYFVFFCCGAHLPMYEHTHLRINTPTYIYIHTHLRINECPNLVNHHHPTIITITPTTVHPPNTGTATTNMAPCQHSSSPHCVEKDRWSAPVYQANHAGSGRQRGGPPRGPWWWGCGARAAWWCGAAGEGVVVDVCAAWGGWKQWWW